MTELTDSKIYSFSGFELDSRRRTLLKDGNSIQLNPKTFDLLLILVAHRGEVLSKNELLDKVWAGQFVEENNLTVHISALRKVLGERKGENRFLVTVPGKGYKFVAELDEEQENEIVIENHSFSRIVVEETEFEDESNEKSLVSQNGLSKQLKETASPERKYTPLDWVKQNRVAVGLITIFLLLAMGVGSYISQRQRRAATAPPILPFAHSQIKRLTTNGNVMIAALSPDGKLFAHIVNDLGQKSLWLGFVEGGNDIRLLEPSEAIFTDLAFSADSKNIFFTITDTANSKFEIYKIPAFGGAKEKVRDGARNFTLSPDGESVAFVRDKEKMPSLIVAGLNGGGEREIALFPANRVLTPASLSWSPDSKQLAFSMASDESGLRQDVSVAQISDGSTRQITNYGWGEINRIAWLADASGLMLIAPDKTPWASVPHSQIWHVDLPGGAARKVTNDLSSYRSSLNISNNVLMTIELRQSNNIWIAPADDLNQIKQVTFSSFGKYDGLWGLDWTPDGKIVYTSSDTQSQIISQINPDGNEQRQLTPPGFIDSLLNVSPDGRFIVFQSTRAGEGFDIWRMDANGENPIRLTTDGKSQQPFVSSDSRSIYYKSFANGVGEMRRISIDGGEPQRLTDKETSWMSVSPGGKFIAAAYETDRTRLAILDAESGKPVKQFDLPKIGTMYTGSRWTPDGKAVMFRDYGHGYWIQSIENGELRRVENLPKEKLYNFAWSKDGKQLAFVRGVEIRDVVIMRNLK
ncbi:MAG: winged helix-turn-helix domain-containing protein [Acidobacteriota bacterium]|nr:winged helix-turn-helix domain-containing protein [Acidobacteriota bacterium]